MVVEEFIGEIETTEGLKEFLVENSNESRICKLWIENLVTPLFYMMLFVRTEREGDWILHLYAVEKMIPLFFCYRSSPLRQI